MKIFMPSTGHIPRLHTHKILPPKLGLIGVFHDTEQSLNWINNLDPSGNFHVLISNAVGMLGQRMFILNQVKIGEWYLSVDDNIRNFIDQDGNILSTNEAWRIINEAVNEAEKRGAKLVGFSPVDNPFFRKTKFRDVGFCVGKMYAEKRTEIKPSMEITTMDDYERTAQHLEKFGRVLVDNRIHSKSKHYEEGGIGTWEKRLEKKMLDCSKLLLCYPGLFRIKQKANKPKGSEVQLRFTNLQQIEEWRFVVNGVRKELIRNGINQDNIRIP